MKNAYAGSLRGQIVIAMPGMIDPNFFQTVTCICENSPEGALGIVFNRIHPSVRGPDIFKELKLDHVPEAESIPIYIGGPVHPSEIFILHGPPFHWQGCLLITPTLALSNTIDLLKAVSEGKGPASFIIGLGCAGWGPGQLENEVLQNAWLTCAATEEILFQIPPEERWEETVRRLGIDPTALSGAAGHA